MYVRNAAGQLINAYSAFLRTAEINAQIFMLKKFIVWIVFTVIIPFIPLICTYLILLFKGIPITAPLLFKNGELLLISLLTTATGVGSVITSDKKPKFKYIPGIFCLIMMIFVTIIYTLVSSEIRSNQNLNIEMVFNFSKWTLISSVIIGGSCILTSEK